MNMRINKSILFLFSMLFIFQSCKQDDENFENKLFLLSPKLETILIKPSVLNVEKQIQVAIAKPQDAEILAKVSVDENQVARFNQAFEEKAELLTKEFYDLPNADLKITAGSVKSESLNITFKNVNALDKSKVYVLPISLNSSSLSVLNSESISYFCFKGGDLINKVAGLEKNYLYFDSWKNPAVVNNLRSFTLEALVRAKDFKNFISTIMGIEGKFLIRIGDAGFPSNQVQVATTAGNMPGADPNKGLTANKWTHIAVAVNGTTGSIKLYIDGALQAEVLKPSLGAVNFGIAGINGFQIGRSYEDARYFNGEFSEVRIWNKERSKDEIAGNFYEVPVDSEGLVSYWKCNEGEGNLIKDHTANQNHMIAKSAINWVNVALPEKTVATK